MKRNRNRIIHATIRSTTSSHSNLPIVSTPRYSLNQRKHFKQVDKKSKLRENKPTRQNIRNEQSDYSKSIFMPKLQRDKLSAKSKNHRKISSSNGRCPVWIRILIFYGILLIFIGFAALLVFLLTPKSSETATPTPTLRWNTSGITVAGTTDVPGTGNQQLNNPWGLVITDTYSLYVADLLNHRVQKFTKDSSIGVTVAGQGNGAWNNTNTTLERPAAILLDSDENLYIADSYNFRVLFWKNGAQSGNVIAGIGGHGNGSNQLRNNYGITKDLVHDIMYVADYENHRVMLYEKSATSGFLFAGGQGSGLNSSQLNGPIWVLFDSFSNALYISNTLSHNILRWKVNENHWSLVVGSILGIAGNTSTSINGARSFTIDPMGNLYVADRRNHRIQFFPADQSVGTTIIGITGESGNSSHLLDDPFGIALDNQLNVYVADSENQRIQKFLRY